MPTVSFFLASSRHPIDDRHPWWNRPLPTSRQSKHAEKPDPTEDETLSYGEYFSAVARFCSEAEWRRVLLAVAEKLEPPPTTDDLESVSIFLDKHGAFYHPARIEVTVSGRRLCLAVNVASSRLGKAALVRETRALAHLNEQRPFGWFPCVYATTEEHPPMFLGEWFGGFHEFHLTRRNEIDEPGIVVWDGAAAPRLLSARQTAALHRNMAMILTACYDPVTTCQIFPWHHAAGDFVVRVDGQKATAKLITVRNYAPLIKETTGPANENELLEALLLFFLHLSVRMRLDRLDGVAEIVWAPDSCIAPTIDGFFQGLDLAARLSGFPEDFPQIFRQYCNAQEKTDLRQMAGQITNTVFAKDSEERRVVASHIETHIETVIERLSA